MLSLATIAITHHFSVGRHQLLWCDRQSTCWVFKGYINILKYGDSNHSSSFHDHYQFSELLSVLLKLKKLLEVQQNSKQSWKFP